MVLYRRHFWCFYDFPGTFLESPSCAWQLWLWIDASQPINFWRDVPGAWATGFLTVPNSDLVVLSSKFIATIWYTDSDKLTRSCLFDFEQPPCGVARWENEQPKLPPFVVRRKAFICRYSHFVTHTQKCLEKTTHHWEKTMDMCVKQTIAI